MMWVLLCQASGKNGERLFFFFCKKMWKYFFFVGWASVSPEDGYLCQHTGDLGGLGPDYQVCTVAHQ